MNLERFVVVIVLDLRTHNPTAKITTTYGIKYISSVVKYGSELPYMKHTRYFPLTKW